MSRRVQAQFYGGWKTCDTNVKQGRKGPGAGNQVDIYNSACMRGGGRKVQRSDIVAPCSSSQAGAVMIENEKQLQGVNGLKMMQRSWRWRQLQTDALQWNNKESYHEEERWRSRKEAERRNGGVAEKSVGKMPQRHSLQGKILERFTVVFKDKEEWMRGKGRSDLHARYGGNIPDNAESGGRRA
ncbi:hypothetical protein K438DRAFT_1782322 [Mycena galopus ATCC 62051]|nr:hypothetical protein K438DRAFT_1782322 [Mycena galopus ATCC 62051]